MSFMLYMDSNLTMFMANHCRCCGIAPPLAIGQNLTVQCL